MIWTYKRKQLYQRICLDNLQEEAYVGEHDDDRELTFLASLGVVTHNGLGWWVTDLIQTES